AAAALARTVERLAHLSLVAARLAAARRSRVETRHSVGRRDLRRRAGLPPVFAVRVAAQARLRAAAAAVAHVPAGVEVEASNNIGPALSGRDTVLLLDGTPRWAPWVVGDTIGLDFPFCTPSQQAQEVAYLRAHGYALVYADHGYMVLHRPADARTAQALAHPLPAARLHTDICY